MADYVSNYTGEEIDSILENVSALPENMESSIGYILENSVYDFHAISLMAVGNGTNKNISIYDLGSLPPFHPSFDDEQFAIGIMNDGNGNYDWSPVLPTADTGSVGVLLYDYQNGGLCWSSISDLKTRLEKET